MSGNTGDMKKTTPVLTGASNYLEWKSAMKSLLQVMGVWRYTHTQVTPVIAATGGPTTKQQATYETNQGKALGMITYYTSWGNPRRKHQGPNYMLELWEE